MKPTRIEEALRSAFKEGVLVLKDRESKEAWVPESWEEVEEFLSQRKEFLRVLWPETEASLAYVRQFHVRGRSVHEDFRWELGKGRVTGITVALPFGLPKASWEELERLAERGRPSKERVREVVLGAILEKWLDIWRDWNRKKVCAPKALQDTSWLRIEDAFFPPGTVGATDYKPGFMVAFDRGTIHFGAQKPDYWEYYLESERGLYTGRLVVVWLPKAEALAELDEDTEEKLGRAAWVAYLFAPREQRPYVTTKRCLESGWEPPEGRSALPKPIERKIPKELRFWEAPQRERAKVHEELVAWADEQDWYERKNPDDWPETLEEVLRA